MKKVYPLIPEDPPSKLSIWRRSYIIRLLKNQYAPIIITFFGFFLAVACLYLFVKSEGWWLKEKIVTVPAIGIHVAKAAEVTQSDIARMTDIEYLNYKFGRRATEAFHIYRAESGGDAYAINKNKDKDGTLDLGCMQLNEKWQLKPRGLTRADAFDCKKSIDVSFQIYTEQGHFCAWTTYKRLYPKACK